MAWSTGERDGSGPRPAPPEPQSEPRLNGARPLRASDAERDGVLGELRDGFAQGRLSHETFVSRVDATLAARRRDELDSQIADLPAAPRLTLTRGLSKQALRARAREVSAMVQATAGRRRKPRPPALTLPTELRQRFTIGRELACDLSIGDLSVSRSHAELRRDADGWQLADLGSMNGTRLNGWRIQGAVAVCPGDLVTFGVVTFVLVGAPTVTGGPAA